MKSLASSKIFITGATGFVGSNLTRRLVDRGADVYANIRETSNTWRLDDILKDISVVKTDLMNYDKLRDQLEKIKPNIIIHTAIYGGGGSQRDIEKIVNTNIIGSVNLLRSCANLNINQLINTGTSSEYGIKHMPMKETDQLEPINDYGVSKAAVTMFCKKFAFVEELPIITLRLFSPFGKYEHITRVVPATVLSALRNQNPLISSREYVRDFIYIDDVLDAYEAAIHNNNFHGQIYNVGTGIQHSIGEVADALTAAVGNDVKVETGMTPFWDNEPKTWCADIHQIEHDLNWKPQNTFIEGITKSVKWIKENVSLYDNWRSHENTNA